MRNFILRMKFFSFPPRQMQKVFPCAGFSLVVRPRMAPSLTDQSRESPSQPVRSLPLKMRTKPGSILPSGTTFCSVKAGVVYKSPITTVRITNLRWIFLLVICFSFLNLPARERCPDAKRNLYHAVQFCLGIYLY